MSLDPGERYVFRVQAEPHRDHVAILVFVGALGIAEEERGPELTTLLFADKKLPFLDRVALALQMTRNA